MLLSPVPSRSVRCPVQDPSQVGESRRIGQELALKLAFSETQAGKLAIVTTELANNIIKHATEGELLFRPLERTGEMVGLEVLALDTGRGIVDVARSQVDGYSTAGSPGTGLGAIKRLADDFAIFSQPGQGTAVVSRIYTKAHAASEITNDYRIGAVCVEKPGEPISGDGWAVARRGDMLVAMVVDGLGHGDGAAEAANEAIRALTDSALREPAQLVELIHFALQKTRGAAVAVATIDPHENSVRYAGLGNIGATIVSTQGGRNRSLVSQNGTAGAETRRIHEHHYPWEHGAVLIMHSDGIKTWSLDAYSGALQYDPAVIVGLLYRDFRRGNDDTTVLAITDR